jgi:hypothetical protein
MLPPPSSFDIEEGIRTSDRRLSNTSQAEAESSNGASIDRGAGTLETLAAFL